jgi:alpha-L-fucosidase 2
VFLRSSVVAIAVLAFNLALSAEPGPATEDLIWLDQPSAYFTESSPIANGRLAAMIFGGTTDERIVLNEASMWSGSKWENARPADVYKELPEIRRLLFAGKMAEAEKSLLERFVTKPVFADNVVIPPGHAPGTGSVTQFGCYQVLANLWLNFVLPERTHIIGYRRELDLASALARVTFQSGRVRFTREAFASAPDDVIVIRLSADRPGMISFRGRLDRPERAKTVADGMNGLLLTGQMQNGVDGQGHRFAARVHAVNRGGMVYTKDNAIFVRHADEVLLFITGLTSGKTFASRQADDPGAVTSAALKKVAAKRYDDLRASHLADHTKYYTRSSLRLRSDDMGMASQPTPLRLAAYAKGSGDHGLVALLFNFGRYALITTSRPGGLPPNLQGLWAEEIQTPWNGDWHLDINLQMNYWAADVCNLGDLNQPLWKLIESCQESGAKTARQYYNARGWVTHIFTNPWGFTLPGWSPGWGVYHGATAWLCQHVWDHYLYTRDRKYLEWAYPILKGAAQFYLDTLIPDPTTKWLVTAPSHSPENPYTMPDGHKASVCIASTADMQMLRHLFGACMEASRILGMDDAMRKTIEATRDRLVPTRVAPDDGRLMEWLEDYRDVDPQHRHLMPLWGAYPGTEITLQKTPQLVDAAKRTLAVRDGEGFAGPGQHVPAWALVVRAAVWARFKDAERCGTLVKTLLRPVSPEVTSQREPAGVYPNLFAAGPPFQIDANLGAPAAIAEMLLQSHNDEIDLLPVLPRDWADGSFDRLRARGGFEVSATWTGGKLSRVKIRRTADGPCRVRYRDKSAVVSVPIEGQVELDGNLVVVAR